MLLGVRTHLLTGGRWERQNFGKKGSMLIAFLRLPQESAARLITFSGSGGIFVSEQHSDGQRLQQTWIGSDESVED